MPVISTTKKAGRVEITATLQRGADSATVSLRYGEVTILMNLDAAEIEAVMDALDAAEEDMQA